jgi:hypothetical protein
MGWLGFVSLRNDGMKSFPGMINGSVLNPVSVAMNVIEN